MNNFPRKIVIGISGASGAIYGIRLLELLREAGVETHLVISKAGNLTIQSETPYSVSDVQKMADYYYAPGDIAAALSSGSFHTDGMIIAPCSMSSLAEIANGITTGLLSRAADVVLKERRRLVIMPRETPLHSGHLENMLKVSNLGGIIAPPVPAFYAKPESLEAMIDHTLGRILDLFNIHIKTIKRWEGLNIK